MIISPAYLLVKAGIKSMPDPLDRGVMRELDFATWAQEYATLGIRLPRQTGKTTTLKKLADDFVNISIFTSTEPVLGGKKTILSLTHRTMGNSASSNFSDKIPDNLPRRLEMLLIDEFALLQRKNANFDPYIYRQCERLFKQNKLAPHFKIIMLGT